MQLYQPNPPGRPLELTQEKMDHILSFVSDYMIPSQIARAAQVHQRNLARWLDKGSEDFENGVDSIYAQFCLKFEEERSKVVKRLSDSILATGKWDATWEILQVVDRENFGKESAQIRELISIISKLSKGKEDHGSQTNA